MTVSAQTPINRSTGNGVTTVFPYGFKILNEADILVTVDGVVKTVNVDYTVSGVGVEAGGNVTFTVAPANLTSVVRRRSMALVRTIDYQDQGELPAATLDNDIDAAILMIQQLDEEIGRSLTIPAGVAGVSTELPKPVPVYLIGWDVTGTFLVNYDGVALAGSAAVVNWTHDTFSGTGAQTVFPLTSAPGSADNCDVSISGVSQRSGLDYTVSGTTLTFLAAPPSGTNNVFVRYGATLPTGVPGDGTVTTAKIADSNVTTAKIADSNVTTAKIADSNVTQAKLAANVAGTGPAFSVYRTGNQSITTATWTKVQLGTEDFDTAGAFDSATNYRFQPAVAGYYALSGGLQNSSSAGYSASGISIYKNGSNHKRGSSSNVGNGQHVSALIYLNGTTDYVELWVNVTATTPSIDGGADATYFTGFLARKA